MPLNQAQICAMNYHYFRFTYDHFLNDLVSLGIENTELWGAYPHFSVFHSTSSDARKIRSLVAERHLNLVCFTPEQCLYPVNIAAPDEDLRRSSQRYFMKAIDLCAEMNCPMLMITPGFGFANHSREETWKRSAESIALIVDYGHRRGLTMVLEHLTRFECNVINSSEQVLQMLEDVGSPELKVILDINQMALEDETVADFTKKFGSRLAHCHFQDGTPDGHLAWGDGSLPLSKYIREFNDADYKGVLSLEFINAHYWLDPLKPLKQSVEALKHAFASHS